MKIKLKRGSVITYKDGFKVIAGVDCIIKINEVKK